MISIKRALPLSLLLLVVCLVAFTAAEAQSAIFTDRAAFNAAATNLRLINFDDHRTTE